MVAFPSTVEIIQLCIVALHFFVSGGLIVTLFVWRDIAKSGSRMGFTTLMIVVNLVLMVEAVLRVRDIETSLRTDGIEIFPPMPVISVIVLTASSLALSLFTRFKCLHVAASITFWSAFGSIFLTLAVLATHNGSSIFAWVIAAFCFFLTALQAWAWTIIPDMQNPRGTKDQRRTDVFSWILVACYTAFLATTLALILFGNPILRVLDSDGLVYIIISLVGRHIPLPIVFTVAGIFFYWNDISLPGDEVKSE